MSKEPDIRDPGMALKHLSILSGELLEWVWRPGKAVDQIDVAELPGVPDYGKLTPPANLRFTPRKFPLPWPGPNRYYWLRFTVACPQGPAGDGPLFLRGKLSAAGWSARNPQGIVLINGRAAGGMDTAHSLVRVAERTQPGKSWQVAILVWSGMEQQPGSADGMELVQLDAAGERFALDFDTAVKTAELLDPEDYRRQPLLDACTQAASRIDLAKPIGEGFHRSLPRAHAALLEAMSRIDLPKDRPVASLVGHGHLDLGWLWPVEASHFKALNTVINQLNIIDELDDHVFLWSQPQSWQWIQKDHPPTWQRIVEKVKSGQWESSGAMWVEADTNITGGESLVRQLLYGTRFLRRHLGQEERLLWLPDVFGFTAALPQLLRQFGIDYFMTTKISWNEYNEFPWETFHWQGLDGARVLTHFGSARTGPGGYITYNANLQPKALFDGWRAYRAKRLTHKFLVSFGYGDGGGGPTRRQVQYGQRLGRMPGLPAARFQRPREFFAELAEEARGGRFPVWNGELYLEFHRGTYTTEGRTKRGNRLCENALHDAELLASLALPLGARWDKQTLDACWEKLLLNQFHDILPGSSIQAVYDQAERDYASILGQAGQLRDRSAGLLAGQVNTTKARQPLVVFNTAGHPRSDVVQLPAGLTDADVALRFAGGATRPSQKGSDPDGRAYRIAEVADVPPLGWTVADVVKAPSKKRATKDPCDLVVTARLLENRFWRIELDGAGRIKGLLDKQADRQVLAEPVGNCGPCKMIGGVELGNQLQLFRDRPRQTFAWDVDYCDVQQPMALLSAKGAEVVERGPVRAAVRYRYPFGRSRLVQDIRIYRAIPRIDFVTWADWHERDTLLKAAFPVSVLAAEATFEIQFGCVRRPTHRNTSWDVARFEVPAQRWIDLGECGYGVSLLNDCKYGHDVAGNVVRISLLRGPLRAHNDGYADQGEHRFTYSLLPHAGDWRDGTVEAAAELNLPLVAVPAQRHRGTLPARFALVAADQPNFVLATVKKCEDDPRLIVRGYEAHGRRGPVTLRFGRKVRAAWRSRADEREQKSLKVAADHSVTFNVRPFEVVTLKIDQK